MAVVQQGPVDVHRRWSCGVTGLPILREDLLDLYVMTWTTCPALTPGSNLKNESSGTSPLSQ